MTGWVFDPCSVDGLHWKLYRDGKLMEARV